MRLLPIAALLLTGALGAQSPQYTKFGQACPGTNQTLPRISFFAPPQIGQPFSVQVVNALQSTPVILVFGISDTNYFGLPLPFDMGVLGAPGCNLYTGPVIAAAGMTNVFGSGGGQTLIIPRDQSLLGGVFFNQFWVVDIFANLAGLVVSEGGKGTIGL